MEEENTTLTLILQTAREEFLAKGFQGASLRSIVKKVGVTTGAFYRYYPTKEALFDALVKPAADAIRGCFARGLREIRETPPEKQTEEMLHVSSDSLDQILDYIYAGHYDAAKLLLCCAAGTSYENFVQEIVEQEVDATERYLDALRSLGHPVPELDRGLCQMISSGMFSGVFEMVVQDMNKEEAVKRIQYLKEFHIGGWERILGVKFD